MKLQIVAIIYHEPEWAETQRCIESSGIPAIYVERNPKGVGSLAEAINRGFRLTDAEFVWFVTNVTFTPDVPMRLLDAISASPSCTAVHPTFNSDHAHMQQNGMIGLKEVPFVEFTAAMVRSSIFKNQPLFESMPYVGHDMAWGYEMRMQGNTVCVLHGTSIGHTYIRHKKIRNAYTEKRKKLRRQAVKSTTQRLIELYGPDYKDKIQYHNAL